MGANLMKVLCSISTRGRYDTTLPLAIQSVITQTVPPQKLVIFDDNDDPIDMRTIQTYRYLFMMLELKNIKWQWIYAERKGQHFNHDKAQKMALSEGYDWVWRLDDDTVAECDVLQRLLSFIVSEGVDNIGAVGGSILTPPLPHFDSRPTGKIEHINNEPNIQWNNIPRTTEVDHLHCSFIYKVGIHEYDLNLSRIAHREETLFTYGLKRKGYKVFVIPHCVTWHLKNPVGGIRDGQKEMFDHDEQIFVNFINEKSTKIVVLDCGMGDHVVFSHVLKDIKEPVQVFTCYPEIVPGRSIQEAKQILGKNYDNYNIYRKMDEWNWKGSLEDAFRKMYGVEQ